VEDMLISLTQAETTRNGTLEKEEEEERKKRRRGIVRQPP